ncbi:MAG: IS110 family transposase [Actinobacteria bacterium]|nr:IS110 family transposase [Actinomycetota bacterium]
MNPLYVGIDVAQKENWACLMNSTGDELSTFSFSNDLTGATGLKDKCLALAAQHSIDSLLVGMEATATYWWHLSVYLSTEAELSHLYPKVYSINPKIVKGFKKSYPFLPKTDRIDAWVIADRLRFGRLPAECYHDERYQPLQRLTRFRYRLIKQITDEKNYFLSYLSLKFNTFKPRGIITNTFGATSTAILTEFYSVDEIAETDIDELAAFVQKSSNNTITDPVEVAESVKQAARDAYRLDKKILEPINFILATTLRNIQALQAQVKITDLAIAKEIAHIPHTLGTVKGLGPVLCAGIIAEVGDVTRFKDQAALAKYAGLTWHVRRSGQFEAEETHMSKTGNPYLRYYLYEAANSLRVHNDEYRAYYERKYAEAKTHHHRRATALTARKLVRLVFSLLQSKRLYEPKVGVFR